MRVATILCKDRRTAKKHCPWASRIIKVTDGYKCFESIYDYEVWKNQKQLIKKEN